MSKVVVCTMLSVDGYTEGPGGDVMAMPMDLAFAEHNADRLRTADSVLFGATTFRGMAQFWPGEEKNMEAPEEHRYVAQRYADGLPITVVSDTVTEDDAGVFREQTTIVRRADAHDHIAEAPRAGRRRRADVRQPDAVGATSSPTAWSTSCT